MLFRSLALAAFASAASAQTVSNLIGTLYTTPDLSNLSSYLGLYPSFAGQLSELSNITILAPSNAAFAQLTNATAISPTNSAYIAALLSYHVLNGTYMASDFTNQSVFLPTALVDPAYANVTGGQVVEAKVSSTSNITFTSGLFSQANLTNASTSMNFSGGVIHIVDSLLEIPDTLNMTAIDFNLTSAVGVLNRTGLLETVDGMSDITGFIPNNAAFRRVSDALLDLSDADLGSILEYHLVNASGFIPVTTSSMNSTNVTTTDNSTTAAANTTSAGGSTIGYSTNLSNMTLTSVSGMDLTITIIDNITFVNGAKILTENILISNGVFHIIDNVLNPSNTTIVPVATATSSQAPQFSVASSTASEDVFTSGVPTPTSTIPIYLTATNTVTVTNTEVSSTPVSSGAGASATSKAMAPAPTGAIGAAALFGGAAILMNM